MHRPELVQSGLETVNRLSTHYSVRQTVPDRYNSMWKIMSPQFILALTYMNYLWFSMSKN